MKTKRILAVLTAITAIGTFSAFSAYAEDTTEPETQAVTETADTDEDSAEAETEAPTEEVTEAVTTTAPAETTEAVTTDDDDDFDMPGGELCNGCEFKLGNESFIALTYTLDSTGEKMYIGFGKGSLDDRENLSETNLKNIEIGTKSDEKAENFFTVNGEFLTIKSTNETYIWNKDDEKFVKVSDEPVVTSTTSSTAFEGTTTVSAAVSSTGSKSTTTAPKTTAASATTKKAENSDSPKTGDSFGGVLALLALAGGTAFASRRKNK